jgi:hypothetical protein
MSDVAKALSGLEPDAIRRVLKWATDRYQTRVPGQAEGAGAEAAVAERRSFADFPSFFDAANPQSGPDKALVAAYWFQVVKGQEDLDSSALNRELKNLGHPSTNITRDLDALIKRTPRLVIQVRKSGTTKQARKKYKLTREGIRAVERMIGAVSEE